MFFWSFIARIYGRLFLSPLWSYQHNKVTIVVVRRLFPKFAAAQTWGSTIFVRNGYYFEGRLARHELAHVEQWKRLGLLFPPVYFFLMLKTALKEGFNRNAYTQHPMEIEAQRREVE